MLEIMILKYLYLFPDITKRYHHACVIFLYSKFVNDKYVLCLRFFGTAIGR